MWTSSNAIDKEVNAAGIMQTSAYASTIYVISATKVKGFTPYFFYNPYHFYYFVFYNARSHKNTTIVL